MGYAEKHSPFLISINSYNMCYIRGSDNIIGGAFTMSNKLNISKTVASSLFLPLSSGEVKMPLYKKSDTYRVDENSYGEPSIIDALWDKEVQSTYTSPRNVRRVIIGKEYIVNLFWKEMVESNKKGKMFAKAKTGIAQKTSDIEFSYAEKPALLSLNRWALSNIESIYLDLSALSCNSFPYIVANTQDSEILSIFNKTVDSLIGGDYRSRYNRLKEVVLFTSIADYNILLNAEHIDNDTIKQLSDKAVENNINNFKVFKYDESRLNASEYNTNFTTSPNIYQYDKEYLLDYFRDLCREYDRKKKKPLEETNQSQENSSTESDIEKALNRIKLSCTSDGAFIGALQVIGHIDMKATVYASLSDKFKEENRDLLIKAFSDSSLYLG